jgi:hypothetical protein
MKRKFVHRESQAHKDAKIIARESFLNYFPRVYEEYPLSCESIASGWIGPIPSYLQCKEMGSDPFAVVDVMCCGLSGIPKVGIEICCTNKVSGTKIKRFSNNNYPSGFVLVEYEASAVIEAMESDQSFLHEPSNVWIWGEPFISPCLEEILEGCASHDYTIKEGFNDDGQNFKSICREPRVDDHGSDVPLESKRKYKPHARWRYRRKGAYEKIFRVKKE